MKGRKSFFRRMFPDRIVNICGKFAPPLWRQPVLESMSKGELHKKMQVEVSPTWDGKG